MYIRANTFIYLFIDNNTHCVLLYRNNKEGFNITAVTNKIRTNVYLDADTKQKVQEIFKQYGLGLSGTFNIFLTQSVLERGIPFEVKIPNDTTIERVKDARINKKMTKVNLGDLKKDLGA